MDGTLPLIYANSLTTQDIITKISAFLQLPKKWILSKFGGHGSKNAPATPIRSFRCFWRNIQIFGILETSNFLQGGFLSRLTTGENLVLISLTIFEKFKFDRFDFLKCHLEGMILSIFIPKNLDVPPKTSKTSCRRVRIIFLSQALQIWWEFILDLVVKMLKFWLWCLEWLQS